MSLDTGAIKYWTGHPGVVTPNDPIATIEAVARAYDIRWLFVERANAVPALGPILDGSGRPGWIGPPVWSVTGTGRHGRRRPLPDLLQPGDPRCVDPGRACGARRRERDGERP